MMATCEQVRWRGRVNDYIHVPDQIDFLATCVYRQLHSSVQVHDLSIDCDSSVTTQLLGFCFIGSNSGAYIQQVVYDKSAAIKYNQLNLSHNAD